VREREIPPPRCGIEITGWARARVPHPPENGGRKRRAYGAGGSCSFRSQRLRTGLTSAAPPALKRSGASGKIGEGLGGVLSFGLQTRRARLPKRGTSGFVQRGPANPARPGREQRYRVSQVCRGDPEVPRFGKTVLSYQFSVVSKAVGWLSYVPALNPRESAKHNWMRSILTGPESSVGPLFASWSLITGRWSLTPSKLAHTKVF